MKPLADDNFIVAEVVQFLFDMVENIVGKKRKSWFPAFSPFPTMFSEGFFPQRHQKLSLHGKDLKTGI